MSSVRFPTGKCSISDDWTYKNMPVVYMENDFIKVGILVGRGSDIFEFIYKPAALDFMLRLDKGIRNPNQDFSQQRGTANQFEDYYYGGWQEALPNSPSFNYRGAHLGQHGEVAMIPWKHAIIENTDKRVVLKLWVRPLRVPVFLEKTITLEHDSQGILISERLVNESKTDLDIMWGHHIAFGLPFLDEGARVMTNAKTFKAEAAMPDHRRFQSDQDATWPIVTDINGQTDDASVIPSSTAPAYSDLAYLSGYPRDAKYALWSEKEQIGFGVQWDANIFSHLWYWQERYATQDSPWWGGAYAVGLEPWTSAWTSEPEKAIEQGDWLKIKAEETKNTQLLAGVMTTEPSI